MGPQVANRSTRHGPTRTCSGVTPRTLRFLSTAVVLASLFRVASGQSNDNADILDSIQSSSSFFTAAPFTIVLCLFILGLSFVTAFLFRQYSDQLCGWYGFAVCCCSVVPEEDTNALGKKGADADVEKNLKKPRHNKRKRPPAILLTKYENENEIWKSKVDYYLKSLASNPDLHYTAEEDEAVLNYKPTLRRKNIVAGAPPHGSRRPPRNNSKRNDSWLGRTFGAKKKFARRAATATQGSASAATTSERPRTATPSGDGGSGRGQKRPASAAGMASQSGRRGSSGGEGRSAASRTSTVAWARSSNKYYPPEIAYAKGSLDLTNSGVEVVKRKLPPLKRKTASNLYQRKYDILLRRSARRVNPAGDDDQDDDRDSADDGENGDELNTQRNEELIVGNAASRTILQLSSDNGESRTSSPSRWAAEQAGSQGAELEQGAHQSERGSSGPSRSATEQAESQGAVINQPQTAEAHQSERGSSGPNRAATEQAGSQGLSQTLTANQSDKGSSGNLASTTARQILIEQQQAVVDPEQVTETFLPQVAIDATDQRITDSSSVTHKSPKR